MSGRDDRLPAAGIIFLGYIAALLVDFPGHISPDGVWQLAQGRAGLYNLWHPPVMAWLLGLADRASRGTWLFVALNGALFFGGLFAFVALEHRPRQVCLPLLVLWMISPIVLIGQGVVLKDVLFANAALVGFTALAWAGRLWEEPARRGVLLCAALLLIGLAALTRQNGIVVAPFAALSLAGIARSRLRVSTRRPLLKALAWSLGGLASAVAIVVLANAMLLARSDGRPENAAHLKVLQAYDLAGAVARDPGVPLPVLRAEAPTLERFVRAQAATHYRAVGADYLFSLPSGPRMLTPRGSAVGRQWFELIRNHPLLYLRTRGAIWLATLTTPPRDACPIIIVGVDGDPAMLARAGLKTRMDAKDAWDEDYASSFIGGPLYSHLFYGAVLIMALAVQAARWLRGDRGPEAVATLGLGFAALAFAASFFFVSVDCDFRFLYFLDVAAMAVTARVVAARWTRKSSDRQAPFPTTAVARRSSLPQPTR